MPTVNNVRTLVTGATGYVGSRLVSALLNEGHEVVATSRDASRLTAFGWYDDVTSVSLDAHDEASAKEAFAEAGPIDVVYYLVHGIGQADFRDADNRAAANVAAAARDAGVGRIVYLGGFVPDGGELSEHLASRAEVAGALTLDDGPEVVWLGAAMIIGAGSTSFEMLRYVTDRFLVIPMPKWAHNPMDPISVSDVLYYLVAAADRDEVPAGCVRHPRLRDHHLRRAPDDLRPAVREVAPRPPGVGRAHSAGVPGDGGGVAGARWPRRGSR